MQNKITTFIKSFIGWPLTIAALFFILKIILSNVSEIFPALRHINGTLLFFGVSSFISYFFLRSIFWKKLLELKGHKLILKDISFYWGFTELKRYIPGNIWSFLSRASMLSENNISLRTTVTSTIIEAEFITLASLLLSLLSLNFIFYGLLPNFPGKQFYVLITAIIVLILTIVFIANQSLLKIKNFKLKIFNYSLHHLFPDFSFLDNFYLLCTKTAAMFFFGLGTYFSISSFHVLYLPYILTLVGFFVFSLLIGYLSIITPMGLGVREGIITFGLAKFIPLSLASFAAIFARIIFIISELLFLLITYTWYKSKSAKIVILENFISTYKYEIFLSIAIILYIVYFTTASFLRYDNFFTGRFDLGNMDQTVWNTLHGRIFQSTDPNGTNIISRLAFHADFILILLAPLYLLWQDPKNLLLIQTLVLSSGAIFIYLIAKKITQKKSLAFLFALLYLLNPAIQYTNLYDFHGVTLVTTLLLGAFYFLKSKQYIWFTIFLFLSGITKEEVWIITAFFGLYALITEKKKILGITICISSLIIFFFLILYAIPHARGSAHFALSYYSDFGSSPKEILKTLFLSPWKIITTLLQFPQLTYLLELFLPLGFLSLFSPLFLLFVVPELAADLLSTNSHPHEIYYQYTATITPLLFIAAIYGYRNIKFQITKNSKFIPFILLIITILAAYLYGPLPGARTPDLDMFTHEQPNKQIISNFLNSIPRRYSVATTNNIGSHLSRRQRIFTIPIGIDQADIILFLLNDPFAQPSLTVQKQMVNNMQYDRKYTEVYELGDFIVFKKTSLVLHYRKTKS